MGLLAVFAQRRESALLSLPNAATKRLPLFPFFLGKKRDPSRRVFKKVGDRWGLAFCAKSFSPLKKTGTYLSLLSVKPLLHTVATV